MDDSDGVIVRDVDTSAVNDEDVLVEMDCSWDSEGVRVADGVTLQLGVRLREPPETSCVGDFVRDSLFVGVRTSEGVTESVSDLLSLTSTELVADGVTEAVNDPETLEDSDTEASFEFVSLPVKEEDDDSDTVPDADGVTEADTVALADAECSTESVEDGVIDLVDDVASEEVTDSEGVGERVTIGEAESEGVPPERDEVGVSVALTDADIEKETEDEEVTSSVELPVPEMLVEKESETSTVAEVLFVGDCVTL